MKKFLMVSTIVPTIAQFNMSNIHILSDMGYQVDVACNYNNSEIWPKGKIKNFKKEIKRLEIGRASCRERVCQYV